MGACHFAFEDETSTFFNPETNDEQTDSLAQFFIDTLRLLDAFTERVDQSRRMAYYHPVADADLPTSDERYIALPIEIPPFPTDEDKKKNDQDIEGARRMWKTDDSWDYPITVLNPPGYRTLLPDLQYGIQSGKIDSHLNSSIDLTAVISSASLLYRLIRVFRLRRCGQCDVNKSSPANSVWHVRLVHHWTESYLVFMDDRGLFDIRGGKDTNAIMKDIKALIELLLRC